MEDSTDDDDTEPDKQSKKIKQSSKKQSEFTLTKKPAKKMKKTKSLKNRSFQTHYHPSQEHRLQVLQP